MKIGENYGKFNFALPCAALRCAALFAAQTGISWGIIPVCAAQRNNRRGIFSLFGPNCVNFKF